MEVPLGFTLSLPDTRLQAGKKPLTEVTPGSDQPPKNSVAPRAERIAIDWYSPM